MASNPHQDLTGPASSPGGGLIIDCDSCTVRGFGCDDCVVTFLLGRPGEEVPLEPLDEDEARALNALADGGLVPPLRLSPRSQTG